MPLPPGPIRFPWALALPVMLLACETPPTPVLGVAVSSAFLDAARLALADAAVADPSAIPDTVLVVERSSRAGPAIEVAQQLVRTPGIVAVVGHSNSSASLAAAQLYNEARVVQLAPTSTATLYSRAGEFSFRMVPPDDVQGAFLAQQTKVLVPVGTRVGLFYVNDDYGRGLRTSLLNALDPSTFPISIELPHSDFDIDTIAISRSMSAAHDVGVGLVIWLGRSATLRVFLPHLRTALGNVPILASDAASAWSVEDEDAQSLEGIWYVDYLDMNASEGRRAFASRFREQFGHEASGADVLTYDAVRVLAAAIADGARTGEQVRDYLRSLGRARAAYSGLAGALSFSDNGDVQRPLVLLTVPPTPQR